MAFRTPSSVSWCIQNMLEEACRSLCPSKLVDNYCNRNQQRLNWEREKNKNILLTIRKGDGKSSCWPLIKSVQGHRVRDEPADLSEASAPDTVSTSSSVLLIYIMMSAGVGNRFSTRGQKPFGKEAWVREKRVGLLEDKTTRPHGNTPSFNTIQRFLLFVFYRKY